MVNQIQKNAQDIEQRLAIIEQACLFKPCPPNKLGQLPSCKEFFTFIEVDTSEGHRISGEKVPSDRSAADESRRARRPHEHRKFPGTPELLRLLGAEDIQFSDGGQSKIQHNIT